MRLATLLMAAIIAPPAAIAEDFPASWQEFTASQRADDKKLVSSITKSGDKSHYDLCIEYGRGERAKKETRRNRAIFEYLLHSKHLNTADLANIKRKDVSVGMSICGVMAALGKPTRGHTRESAYGMTVQMIYERDGYHNTYIHLDSKNYDFIVTSISR